MTCRTCGGRLIGMDVAGFWVLVHQTPPPTPHRIRAIRAARGAS